MTQRGPLTIAEWLRVLRHPTVILIWVAELVALYLDFDDPGHTAAAVLHVASKMSEWIKPVAYLADQTSFCENAKVYLSLVFITYPLLCPLIAVRAIRQEKDYLLARWQNNRKAAYVAIVALPLLSAGILAGALLSNIDPSFCKGCTTESRLGMFVLYGVLLPAASAYALGATGLLLSNIRTILATKHH